MENSSHCHLYCLVNGTSINVSQKHPQSLPINCYLVIITCTCQKLPQEEKLERATMKPTKSVVVKCLVSAMVLVIAVQAQDVLPRVSDSPPSPLLPQAPSRSHVPPPPPHPLNCDQKCSTLCAEKRIFRRMICYGVCMAKCTIFPLEHANFPCTQNCVVNPLHSNPSMNECSS